MLAYGWQKDDKDELLPLKLKEATLSYTKDELDKLILFLNDIKKEIAQTPHIDINDGWHWHYRDWNKQWTEEEGDFIISLHK